MIGIMLNSERVIYYSYLNEEAIKLLSHPCSRLGWATTIKLKSPGSATIFIPFDTREVIYAPIKPHRLGGYKVEPFDKSLTTHRDLKHAIKQAGRCKREFMQEFLQ